MAPLLDKAIVWDSHACMPLRPMDDSFLPQLERCRKSGFNVVSLNVGFGDQTLADHVRMLAQFRHWLAARPQEYRLVKGVEDILAAKQGGQLAVCFDIEGMNAIEEQLSLIQLYYDLGVRWMLVAYNRVNRAGAGCQEAADGGLTDFGRRAIEEMARVGMVLCCSHTGYRTARQAIDHSPRPVIFSHSNPRALRDHPRNIPDDLIRACAARGGVIGINGLGVFLGANDNSTEALVRHIDYVTQLVGDEHVALGLDYVYDTVELDEYLEKMRASFPKSLGYERGLKMVEPERLPRIIEALLAKGYGEATLVKILGGNLLRVARETWL
ncbi:MAG TPA: membrane dipeptidase [Steroidobacteraceae bacterium]|jgi:membrane dipeptidase|nr:membrane dipeptidase [Steroidobacteraceae bacterium]